jgi:putative ABC transport system permease protein
VYSQSGFTDTGFQNVSALPEVKDAQRRTMLDTVADLSGRPKIELYALEENKISKPYITDGAEFDINADGIWLDARFAEARGIKVNDEITLEFAGVKITRAILGLVLSPEYVYNESGGITPDFGSNGYAFIPAAVFTDNPAFVYSQLVIKTDSTDFAAVESDIAAALDGGYSVFINREKHSSYQMFDAEITQHKAMAIIFPPVFALVALLTILTTMARLITAERTQIGTLKAVGFSDGVILRHYIGYGLFISLTAGIFGAVSGPLILPPLFYPSMSGFYTLPVWKPVYDVSFYIMAGITVLLSCLATLLACRSVLRVRAAAALRPKPPKVIGSGKAASPVFQKLGFNLQWNLRDIGRNKTRSLMAVAGALGCAALLVCAFGLNADMTDLRDWQYRQIYRFETKIVLSEGATAQETDAITAAAGGERIMEKAIEVRSGKAKYTGSLLATDGGTLIRYTDKNRNEISLPQSGVNISYKLAGQLGVGVGDKIEWHIFTEDGWKECTVAGIYRSPTAQGLTMSKEVLEGIGYAFVPTAVLSGDSDYAAVGSGAEQIVRRSDLYAGWDALTESFMLMVYILIGAAVLLAVTVLYNLGVLSFTEMTRELATLKVLGFGPRKLNTLFLVQNLILTAIGFAAGIPVGLLLVKAMMASMGDSFDMITKLHFTDVLYSGLITICTAMLVGLLYGFKIKKLNAVAALKSSE